MRKSFKLKARATEPAVTPEPDSEETAPVADEPAPATPEPEDYGKGGVFRSIGGGKRVRV
ncbi:MAG: hypothetical protein M9945_14185 [Aquamicrobium sp.]|uniref:hypothetical protein n=1 Tax=Aquamicrobium sp. TaxID=1872579 RepID=UPI00349E6E51|nr:hypothetical protein [Aquamicrobium sp.]